MSEADAIDFTGIEAITFDCYGTIVDWDAGVLAAVGRVPALAGCDARALVLEREEVEKELLDGTYQPYEDILRKSLSTTAERHGLRIPREELGAFASAMAGWPLFFDSKDALLLLQQHFRLAILSNVERRVLDQSIGPLEEAGVCFCHKITADLVRSYKPGRAHFDRALADLGLSSRGILHVAGSRYHDIVPASRLGWRTLFVDRRSPDGTSGGVSVDDAGGARVASLQALASRLRGQGLEPRDA